MILVVVGNKADLALEILNQFSYEVKKKVQPLWTAKFLPNLRFVIDRSFDYAEKIEKIIIMNSK